MVELERALVIGRAIYERWLGTEPNEIAAAPQRCASSSRITPC
jgi:hypothetical protein